MDSFLSRLQWRHATKSFDETKPAAHDQLGQIMEAIRWAPTSFGVQPFYVKVIRSAEVRKKMHAHGWNQVQFLNATAIFVFVADTNVADRFEKQMELRSQADPEARKTLGVYESVVKGWISQQPAESFKHWTQKQIYLALGFALAACAEIGVDSCPIEGFSPGEFDKILELPKGHYSSVCLAVGNRAAEFKPHPKWRFPTDYLFQFVD